MTARYALPTALAVARAGDGTLFVMPLPDGPPRALNGSAEVIWEVAVSGSGQIVKEVAEAFEVAPDAIAADVEVALRSFSRLGLIEPLMGEDAS